MGLELGLEAELVSCELRRERKDSRAGCDRAQAQAAGQLREPSAWPEGKVLAGHEGKQNFVRPCMQALEVWILA